MMPRPSVRGHHANACFVSAMTQQGLLLVGVSAVLSTAWNLMLRSALTRTGGFGLSQEGLVSDLPRVARQPLFVVGVIMYAGTALAWFRVTSTEDLTTGYPMLVGLTFVLVSLGAVIVFREPVSWRKGLGMGVILAGIAMTASAR